MKHTTAMLRFHVVHLSSLLIVFGCLQVPLTAIHAQHEDRESFAVMTAVLDSLYNSQGNRPSMVVVGDSLTWRPSGVAYGGKLLVPHASHVEVAAIIDFEAKTLRSIAFPVAFRYKRLVRLTPRDHNAFETRAAQIQLATPYRELVDMPFGTPPTISQLQGIAGVYDFTLVSSAVNNRVFPWRMRFVRDTARNSRAIPAFQVLDPKTGARVINREAGTYLESGRVYFPNDSRGMQLHGFGYSLDIRGISPGRLFGEWSHYSPGIPIGRDGRAVPEPAGHFCAVLLPAQ